VHVNQSELPTQRVAEEHVTCCTYEQISASANKSQE
jgi:hypothetical protein